MQASEKENIYYQRIKYISIKIAFWNSKFTEKQCPKASV